MKITLANPRGFCAGVTRAIETVEKALKFYQKQIYVRHEIVHNKTVVEDLKRKGVIFTESLSQVPDDSVLIFSAHGAAKKYFDEAKRKNLTILDATCPLVTKIHKSVQKYSEKNLPIILIGHKGHPEVEGTLGQTDSKNIFVIKNEKEIDELPFSKETPLSYTTQTTLSHYDTSKIISKLNQKFINLNGPDKGGICYATTNRQKAVLQMIKDIDILLVVGSTNSSNSNRLKEIGVNNNIPSYLIDSPIDIKTEWFNKCTHIGITSGASAPENIVQKTVKYVESLFPKAQTCHQKKSEEHVTFSLPKFY